MPKDKDGTKKKVNTPNIYVILIDGCHGLYKIADVAGVDRNWNSPEIAYVTQKSTFCLIITLIRIAETFQILGVVKHGAIHLFKLSYTDG